MDTIISIDLDILMSPYCGIYNDKIHPDEDRQYNWREIEGIIDTNDFEINQEYKKIINNILEKYSKQVNKIYMGYDHSSILSAIEIEKNNLNPEYLFNLYNIDYHHDISYSNSQEKMIIEQGCSSCANWVGFLNYYNCINKYEWYKGIGSGYEKKILNNNILTPKFFKQEVLKNNNFPLDLQDIKILYITYSYPWIPLSKDAELQAMFNNFQSKIYYLEGPYSINHDRKKFLNRIGE